MTFEAGKWNLWILAMTKKKNARSHYVLNIKLKNI